MRLLALAAVLALPMVPLAHDVSAKDAAFLTQAAGARPVPFFYFGAKHMVTGYDHVLFLLGVIFFLYRLRDIALYVSCFALGHSMTLIAGVLGGFSLNAHLVDAAIGFSVLYKAFDNLGGFEALFGRPAPNPKLAVLVFGWIHGLGLASALLERKLPARGLLENLIAFNVGVEAGQIVALSLLVLLIGAFRSTRLFDRFANSLNVALMAAGFGLITYQLTRYYASQVPQI